MLIFEGNAGRVIMLEEGAGFLQGSIGIVRLGDDNIDFEVTKSIITRLTISQQANLQFLHTLGSHIYVYVFGDRMGDITLSGLSFATVDCGLLGLLGAFLGVQKHGLQHMLSWYGRNKASKRPDPVRVIVGSNTVFEGFAVSFNSDVVDPQTNLVQWGLALKTLPPEA